MTHNIRLAGKRDLGSIIQMIAEDDLGAKRDTFTEPLDPHYITAFNKISQDPNQELYVVESDSQKIIGTFQLSFIQYLTYTGGLRAQIEAVRIHKDFRGQGLGHKMFEFAIARAEKAGAHVLQLTSDKKRIDALKFYRGLGFVDSHEGMKLHFKKK